MNTNKKKKNIALILASGTGSRCGLSYPKQFAKINNKTILEITIDNFENHNLIDEIILVTNAEYVEKIKLLTSSYKKVSKVLAGGVTRKDSSYNGISAITETDAIDTIFIINEDNNISAIPKRNMLKRAQIPQCFDINLIKEAHRLANEDNSCIVTDDCGLIMNYNLSPIHIVNGSLDNIKVTFQDDIDFAKTKLLSQKAG